MVACSKIAYYLICTDIGAADGSARVRLFVLKSNDIDAMDGKTNVSVSDCEGVLPVSII